MSANHVSGARCFHESITITDPSFLWLRPSQRAKWKRQ